MAVAVERQQHPVIRHQAVAGSHRGQTQNRLAGAALADDQHAPAINDQHGGMHGQGAAARPLLAGQQDETSRHEQARLRALTGADSQLAGRTAGQANITVIQSLFEDRRVAEPPGSGVVDDQCRLAAALRPVIALADLPQRGGQVGCRHGYRQRMAGCFGCQACVAGRMILDQSHGGRFIDRSRPDRASRTSAAAGNGPRLRRSRRPAGLQY